MDVTSLETAPTAVGASVADSEHGSPSTNAHTSATTAASPSSETKAEADARSLAVKAASLFAGGSSSGKTSDVSVTLQVKHNPDEIVAVYRDTTTGRIISQVPTGVLVRLSEFFDQQAGGLVDWNA